MGRKRQRRTLYIYVGTSRVGQYTRAPNGATSFRYDSEWLSADHAFPISLSMPLSDRIWSGEG
ncbi:MAG: HipA N-terminal domain-containing protein, partial [Gammaproteobacteria bacterium]|nr:HipA N-terminal domain-containing protein [Gammaproteobacteria bacterium]